MEIYILPIPLRRRQETPVLMLLVANKAYHSFFENLMIQTNTDIRHFSWTLNFKNLKVKI